MHSNIQSRKSIFLQLSQHRLIAIYAHCVKSTNWHQLLQLTKSSNNRQECADLPSRSQLSMPPFECGSTVQKKIILTFTFTVNNSPRRGEFDSLPLNLHWVIVLLLFKLFFCYV